MVPLNCSINRIGGGGGTVEEEVITAGLLQLFTRSTKDCTSILHFYMEAKRSLISATEGMVSLGYTLATSCAKLSYLSRNSFCQI